MEDGRWEMPPREKGESGLETYRSDSARGRETCAQHTWDRARSERQSADPSTPLRTSESAHSKKVDTMALPPSPLFLRNEANAFRGTLLVHATVGQGVTETKNAKNALASFGFVLGSRVPVRGVLMRGCEPRLAMVWRATDCFGKYVDRGGEFDRVPMALPPLIWEVGSCLSTGSTNSQRGSLRTWLRN